MVISGGQKRVTFLAANRPDRGCSTRTECLVSRRRQVEGCEEGSLNFVIAVIIVKPENNAVPGFVEGQNNKIGRSSVVLTGFAMRAISAQNPDGQPVGTVKYQTHPKNPGRAIFISEAGGCLVDFVASFYAECGFGTAMQTTNWLQTARTMRRSQHCVVRSPLSATENGNFGRLLHSIGRDEAPYFRHGRAAIRYVCHRAAGRVRANAAFNRGVRVPAIGSLTDRHRRRDSQCAPEAEMHPDQIEPPDSPSKGPPGVSLFRLTL